MDRQDDTPSKTQRKREALRLQALGESLIGLPPRILDELALPVELRQAVDAAKKMTKRGALYRQRQWIGKLMRAIDVEPITEKLDELNARHRAATRIHHEAERWRDRLLDGDDDAVQELIQCYPSSDRSRIRLLVRKARQERRTDAAPVSSRKLFRYLYELIEMSDRDRTDRMR